MTSRRRRPTSPSPAQAQAQPLEDDDLLSEILLRLPAKPSSLPRASLVCKRWRRVVSDSVFLRRFRSHHGKPPLLGFFKVSYRNPIFIPTLDPPDRISAARFSLQLPLPGGGGGSPPVFGHFYHMFAFRHGRALIYDRSLLQITVWDPVTGDRRAVDIPEPFGRRPVYVSNWAMRCVDGHVHGGCHSSPFEVVVIGFNKYRRRLFTCVYSSDTGNWGKVISNAFNFSGHKTRSSTLVGNFFYCLFQSVIGTVILQFDLDTQIPAQIDVLPEMHGDGGDQISPAEDGGLLFLAVRDFSLNLWKHKINSDSAAAGWVLEKTIELDRLLPFEPRPDTDTPAPMNILGFAEEHNVVFLTTAIGVFMVNLESMQFKILPQAPGVGICHPFTSFYTKVTFIVPLTAWFLDELSYI
ncbi:hypothetical protein OsI_32945 [Oryza sativa Indica Group]|nr:hypothetical protein OsI_32945 [Oryza sativa Indica Group]